MGGHIVKEINLGKFLGKRINLIFTTLRNRTDSYKADLVNKFKQDVLPGFSTNKFIPIVDSIHSIDDIKKAHELIETNQNKGKIILKWN